MSENYFVSHCDEYCGLGSFQYKCPCCDKTGHDYDEPWSNHDSGKSVEGLVIQCEHCKKYLLLHEKDYEVTLEEAKSVTLYILIIQHSANSYQIHMHNGEIWSSDTEQAAKDCAATVKTEFPFATIQVLKVHGPPGMTLEDTKKHMLEELRKITRSGPDASH